jgi:hypothetical protein
VGHIVNMTTKPRSIFIIDDTPDYKDEKNGPTLIALLTLYRAWGSIARGGNEPESAKSGGWSDYLFL